MNLVLKTDFVKDSTFASLNLFCFETEIVSETTVLKTTDYTYVFHLADSECHQAENTAFSNRHICYHFSLCLTGEIKLQENHHYKCSNNNHSWKYIVCSSVTNSYDCVQEQTQVVGFSP